MTAVSRFCINILAAYVSQPISFHILKDYDLNKFKLEMCNTGLILTANVLNVFFYLWNRKTHLINPI